MRDTPIPGSYEVRDFIEEIDASKINKTYNFKGLGRKKDPDPWRHGAALMPGLYKKTDFIQEKEKRPATYSFKSTTRENKHSLVVGIQDKFLQASDISPVKYALEYSEVTKTPSKHAAFKSQSSRFPTIYFTPKPGPSPTEYEAKKPSSPHVTSSFKSTTPRFSKPHALKTPGPGSYTRMDQSPMPLHIKEVGRYHGVFFPAGVCR